MNCLLRSTINQIQNKINKLNCDINRGGCITFAKLLAQELEKRDIKFSVVLMDYDKMYINLIRKQIINKEYDDLESVYHVALKIEDLIVDGEESIKKVAKHLKYTQFKVSSNFLQIYEKNAMWNSVFRRVLFSNKIRNIIKTEFKEYDKIKNMP